MKSENKSAKSAQSIKEKDQFLFDEATKFLLSLEGVSEDDIRLHLTPNSGTKSKTINEIYKQFVISAQNKQMSSNVIGKSIGGIDNIGSVLFDFDPYEVARKYCKNDGQKLLEEIKMKLNPRGEIREGKRSLWPQYCQSLLESAYFLKNFKNADEFYSWVDFFVGDEKTKYALPLLISLDIFGISLPLACDLLKELGYKEYGKPDVHLKYIFREVNLIDRDERSDIRQNIETLRVIDRMADSCGVTPYQIDKIFWLIGSGYFYRLKPEKRVGQNREKFVEHIKKNTNWNSR